MAKAKKTKIVEVPVADSDEEVVEVAKKVKKTKRPPSAYNVFVKQNYPSVKHPPAKTRLGEIAKLWAAHKAKMSK